MLLGCSSRPLMSKCLCAPDKSTPRNTGNDCNIVLLGDYNILNIKRRLQYFRLLIQTSVCFPTFSAVSFRVTRTQRLWVFFEKKSTSVVFIKNPF